MKSKKQIMTIGSLQLFYLFRRALGLFSLFALIYFNAQVSLVGNVVVIDHSQDSVYIAAGTYVCHLPKPEKQTQTKTVTKITKTVTVKSKVPAKLVSGNNGRTESTYHYTSRHTEDALASFSDHKTGCSGSTDHYRKHFISIMMWDSTKALSFFCSQISTITAQIQTKFLDFSLRIRPPPTI